MESHCTYQLLLLSTIVICCSDPTHHAHPFPVIVSHMLFHISLPISVSIASLFPLCCLPYSLQQGYECTPCLPGYYQPLSAADDSCIPCPSQTYQPDFGKTACIAVPEGYFQDSAGSKSYRSCESAGYPPPCLKPYAMAKGLQWAVIGLAGLGGLCCLVLLVMVIAYRYKR